MATAETIISTLLPALTIAGLAGFIMYYFSALAPRAGTLEWIHRAVDKPRFRFKFTLHKLRRGDVLAIALILVVFGFADFYKLGDFDAPQSYAHFDALPSEFGAYAGEDVIIDLGESQTVSRVFYFTGTWTGGYRLDFSDDGYSWTEALPPENSSWETAMIQTHADLFKWMTAQLPAEGITARYLKITAKSFPIELGELALYNAEGAGITIDLSSALSGSAYPDGAAALFDEQSLVPARWSYLNGMYFDEIYHGRTALETIRGVYPYEGVHPPLGKTLISLGIRAFGMTPFGWRCVGALFGVLMLWVLYVIIANMFGKRLISVCGTLLFAFDFMHFTQTRIATVDTYGVFFILLSFLFMYRFLAADPRGRMIKQMLPLSLCGISFGLGAASKWIVIYAGAGLAVMWLLRIITGRGYYYEGRALPKKKYYSRVLITIAVSAVFFLVIPAIIYILAYIPFGHGRGMTVRDGMLWDPRYYKLIKDVNVGMFTYHKNLVVSTPHPYASDWWKWVLDIRPMLYWMDYGVGNNLRSSFATFGNPIVWWGGLAAIFVVCSHSIRDRDSKALLIVIGYFAQLGPWILMWALDGREVYVYHYFGATVFLVLALAYMLDKIAERRFMREKRWILGFTIAAGALFCLFYPAISGANVDQTFARYALHWLPSWPI
ncbi:MAG: phospholipid carrier-dependent glycosyltransferase [Oscillospiraceae bacterium]|jgi:hypothetical protein|nr:phospholipid carrier-dependent glycosyltransferase [Oscillospiraceae bacterium]